MIIRRMTAIAINFLLRDWNEIARHILLIVGTPLLLALTVTFAHARPLTAAEEATLGGLDSNGHAQIAAVHLAEQLGRENNLDAIPVLLRLKSAYLLSYFANNYQAPASPELEALVLPYLKEPTHWAANPLSGLLHNYHSREVFDALYQHARQSLILMNSPMSPGMPSELTRPNINVLTSTDLKNIEEPVAQLLPLASNANQVYAYVGFLNERRYVPATSRLAALLKRTPVVDYHNTVAETLMHFDTTKATTAVRERLDWLMTQPVCPVKQRDKKAIYTFSVMITPDNQPKIPPICRDYEIVDIVSMLAAYGGHPHITPAEMDHIEANLARR